MCASLQKIQGLGCFWGVFGPILALFGQNRPLWAKIGPNTPQKTPPKPGFLVKKWPQGHPSAGGEVGSEIFSYLVHTYIPTYVGGAPLSPHVYTQKDGKHPPPLLSLCHMRNPEHQKGVNAARFPCGLALTWSVALTQFGRASAYASIVGLHNDHIL